MTIKTNKEQETWEKFITAFKSKLLVPSHTWIDSLQFSVPFFENQSEIFIIKSNQTFGVNFLQTKHIKEAEEAFYETTGFKRPVRFVYDETLKPKKKTQKAPKQTEEEKEHIKTAQKMENMSQIFTYSGLNSKYTFENYVAGDNSKFAYKIAQLIAETPGETKYNPLFISGSVGLGKTHLMQAIGHKILRNFPHLKIKYVKTEEFANKLIEALGKCRNSGDLNEKMRHFREIYRSIDVLLIDDIQFIEGKKRVQEEIFNTFDALYQANKQIVFASDRPACAFDFVPERLKTRLGWGIEANIKIPNLETRINIVKKYAEISEFPISDEVAMFLAKEFDSNIRELEGAFNKASVSASIEEVELTVENAKEFLNIDERRKKLKVPDILSTCAKYFNVEVDDILSTARAKEIANARKFAIYFTRELMELSYPEIGIEFNKTHSTALYLHDQIKDALKTNRAMQIIAQELQELLKK